MPMSGSDTNPPFPKQHCVLLTPRGGVGKQEIEVEAQILSSEGGGLWRCELGNKQQVLCSLGSPFKSKARGKAKRPPWLVPGDSVLCVLSIYDLGRGRITQLLTKRV